MADILHIGPQEHPAIVALMSTAKDPLDQGFMRDLLIACGRDLLLLHPGLKYEAVFEEDDDVPDEIAEGYIPMTLIASGYQSSVANDQFLVYLMYFPDGRVGARINTSNSTMNSGVNTYLWPVEL